MHRINPDLDIINLVIEAVRKARPDDAFCKSIQHQYLERGGLSKKQLEGLHGKAKRIPDINPARLATLEAIIKKKPEKERAPATAPVKNEVEKDNASGEMIRAVLNKYPEHKRVLLFKSKYEKDGSLLPAEKTELEKFHKILIK